MNAIIYMLTLCASFSGLIMGIILSNISIEEITAVSKYLKYLNIILVAAITFLATYRIHMLCAIILTLIVVIAYMMFRDRNNDMWTYSGMGALFYISLVGNELLSVSVLIFVYGLSISTIYATDAYKNHINKRCDTLTIKENFRLTKNILSRHSLFLIVGILFYIISGVIRNI